MKAKIKAFVALLLTVLLLFSLSLPSFAYDYGTPEVKKWLKLKNMATKNAAL